MTTISSLNKQIAEEAAAWAVALDDAPLRRDDKAALLAWLKTSPVHLDEFLMALSLLEGIGVAGAEMKTDIDALLRAASADVVPIAAAETAAEAAPCARNESAKGGRAGGGTASSFILRRIARSAAAPAIAASLALVLAAGAALFRPPTNEEAPVDPTVVATALGEQRSVTLEDGSIIYVNTQSKVSVRYTEEYRLVDIERGEALFEVEKDPARPFRVVAGDAVAEALGTRFNVRYLDEKTEISVIEGTVAFARRRNAAFPAGGPDRTAGQTPPAGRAESGRLVLVAGQQADFSAASAAPTVTATDMRAIIAWTNRKLMFDEDPLNRVAAEFNRYNRRKLVIGDEALGAARVSGVFSSDDPESLVEFLRLTSEVSVERSGGEIRIDAAETL